MAEVIKSCVMASLTVGSGWPFKLAIMPALAQLGNAMAAIARPRFSIFAGTGGLARLRLAISHTIIIS